MSQICPECKGGGRKKIGFFRTKVCGTCNGKGYVRNQASDIQQQPFFEDGLISVPFAGTEKQQPQEEFSGKGGVFGGAGASEHWDIPHHSSDRDSGSSSSSSDSSGGSSSDSGGSSGGGWD